MYVPAPPNFSPPELAVRSLVLAFASVVVTILVGLVYTSMLFMVVPLVTTLESLDDSLIEAGYDLGGGGFSILREVVIPHALQTLVRIDDTV